MKISCPHCDADIDVIEEKQLLSCPSCGSRLHFLDDTLLQTKDEPKVVAHFELLEQVGRGHFGDVWKARDAVLNRLVAVKIPRTGGLDHKTVQLFVREARAAAKLRHDNIVTVHQVFLDDQAVYIVSDLINGVTLAEQMRHKRRTPREAAELCATIAEALHYAHNNGVEAHRDIKPGNVMVDTAGKPYLMDFGLAKLDSADFTMTVAGQLLGTPAYMSPEQAQGKETDRHTDIYSLGIILYELITYRRPFTGDTKLLIHQIVSEEPLAPRRVNKSIPRPLETICLKAIAKDPKRRYATAAEFAADLRRFLDGKPILAKPVSPLEKGWRWVVRNPVVAGLSAAAAVLLIALAVAYLDRQFDYIAQTQLVALDTQPSGATVILVELDDLDRPVKIEGKLARTVVTSPVLMRLRPAKYAVSAVTNDGDFHEVYRKVPKPKSNEGIGGHNHNSWEERPGGTIDLPRIVIPPMASVIRDMTRIPGGTFQMGTKALPDVPPHSLEVAEFYLDTTEVTNTSFDAVLGMQRTAVAGRAPDEPVTMVSFDDALTYAELSGKRLMTESEYEYAATGQGRHEFPWGNDQSLVTPDIFRIQLVGRPDFDHTATVPAVSGLCTNVAEWTDSIQIPYLDPERLFTDVYKHKLQGSRVVRGGPAVDGDLTTIFHERPILHYGPRRRAAVDVITRSPTIGFRCARSARPRFVD